MANFMSSNIVEEVGAEVAQFMGYNNLKPEQKQIISGILSQRDVFGILPTQWIWQVPLLRQPSTDIWQNT